MGILSEEVTLPFSLPFLVEMGNQLLKEGIFSPRNKFFPLEVDPIQKKKLLVQQIGIHAS